MSYIKENSEHSEIERVILHILIVAVRKIMYACIVKYRRSAGIHFKKMDKFGYYTLFYKQHFYKQHKAKIGKK